MQDPEGQSSVKNNPQVNGADCFVSTERYLQLLDRMATRILSLDRVPDCFIGIKRSGLFPAVYLSHKLKRPMLVDSETKSFPVSKFPLVAIVDTTCWNGRSMRTVYNRLLNQGVEKIVTIVMYARRDPPPNIPELITEEHSDTIPRFWYEDPHDTSTCD